MYKWKRNSALGGLLITYDAYNDLGARIGQVAVEYRPTKYTSRSGSLPRVKQYSATAGTAGKDLRFHGAHKSLRAAKAAVETEYKRATPEVYCPECSKLVPVRDAKVHGHNLVLHIPRDPVEAR